MKSAIIVAAFLAFISVVAFGKGLTKQEVEHLQSLIPAIGQNVDQYTVFGGLQAKGSERNVTLTFIITGLPPETRFMTPDEFVKAMRNKQIDGICKEEFTRSLISNGGKLTYRYVDINRAELFALTYSEKSCKK